MTNAARSTLTTLASLVALSLGLAACAAEAVEEEEKGETTSNLSVLGKQPQFRMRQAKRLLRTAAAPLPPNTAKGALIAQALDQVESGIAFDNANVSKNENERNESIANESVKSSIATCSALLPDAATNDAISPNVDCLLDAAVTKLAGATHDKGGFRVKAIHTIKSALATPIGQ